MRTSVIITCYFIFCFIDSTNALEAPSKKKRTLEFGLGINILGPAIMIKGGEEINASILNYIKLLDLEITYNLSNPKNYEKDHIYKPARLPVSPGGNVRTTIH